jgi:hypothetical protein
MKKKIVGMLIVLTSICGLAIAQLEGTIRILENYWFLDDKQIQFGNFPDSAIEYDTNQTNDSLVIGLPATDDRLILTQKADMGTNFGFTDANTPTLSIMSADGTNAINLYSDGTDAIIASKNGSVKFMTHAITTSADYISTSTTNIGWSIVSGANATCNSTCTFGCVHGWETSSGEVAVACTDATADKCLCAGAN